MARSWPLKSWLGSIEMASPLRMRPGAGIGRAEITAATMALATVKSWSRGGLECEHRRGWKPRGRGLHHGGPGFVAGREEGSPGLGFGFGLAGAAGGQQSEDQIKNQVNQVNRVR